MDQWFQWCVLALVMHYANAQAVSATCKDPGTPGSFEVKFNYDRQGTTTATGLESYDASENPNFVTTVTGTGCTTTTLTNDIYTISLTVNTASALPCGIEQDAADTSVYKFAFSPVGVEKVYTFQCDVDDLQIPSVVENNGFHTQHTDKTLTLIQNAISAKLQVVLADGYQVPVGEVPVGQPVLLRLIFDNGLYDRKPNMCGTSFHLSSTTAATTTIQIFTSGLGTRVKISGMNAGAPIDEMRFVKRQTPVLFEIPVEYKPSGTFSSWTKHDGIKIEGLDDHVCVRIRTGGPFGMYTVFPDHFLGTSYRAVDYQGKGGPNTDFFITAIQDGTVLTFEFNDYLLSSTPTIAGTPATSTTTVTLDAMEGLHINCGECRYIFIESTAKISFVNSAVIPDVTAGSLRDGFQMNQIPDKTYLDKEFVITATVGAKPATALFTTETLDQQVNYTTNTQASTTFTNAVSVEKAGERVSVDTPVYAFQSVNEASCSGYVNLLTGRRQWSTHHEFYSLMEPNEYVVADVVARPSDIGNIYVSSIGGDNPLNYGTLGDPIPVLGSHPAEDQYQHYYSSFSNNRFYSIYTRDETKPFFVSLLQIKVSAIIDECTSYTTFGTTFSAINPCVPSAARNLPGNNVDDDCDTFKDEELQDGIDNDGDGKIDEDNAVLKETPPYGVNVEYLVVSDNAAFTGPNTVTVHNDGCNTFTGGDIHGTIGTFTKNNNLDNVYKDLWVMDTSTFRAYKWHGSDYVYFRVVFHWCFKSDGNDCEQSCATGRKRRATGNLDHTDFRLLVNSTSHNNSEEKKAWRCTASKIYWIPHASLLLIILIEVVTTVYFLYVKYKLTRN